MAERRYTSKSKRLLKENESERPNHTFSYRWRDITGHRKVIYAKTLEELREKEKLIAKNQIDGIRTDSISLNDGYNMWIEIKRGLKNTTKCNYKYMYETFVKDSFGNTKVHNLTKLAIMQFYGHLADNKGLHFSSLDSIQNILYQICSLLVENGYMRNNVCANCLKEFKRAKNINVEKKKALTLIQQNTLLSFVKRSPIYKSFYNTLVVALGCGLRVGEITALDWKSVNFQDNTITIDKNLVYYKNDLGHSQYEVTSPKTKAGIRIIPMIDSVRKALLDEKDYQQLTGIKSVEKIDIIFPNRFGHFQNQSGLNRKIKRIIRDCNLEILNDLKHHSEEEILPPFSFHSLRHSMATRLIESGTNIKIVQDLLGHKDISTTLDIYADVTKEFRNSEVSNFNNYMNDSIITFKPNLIPN